MAAQFEQSGIRFLYPENWTLQREDSDDGWTVTVQSPATAFLLLTLNKDFPEPDSMLASTLEALKADYPGLEIEEHADTVAGQAAAGYNIAFISLDLTNTCWIRSFRTGAGTVLILYQYNDLEEERYARVLQAICVSLQVKPADS
jgi:hypothetical protein